MASYITYRNPPPPKARVRRITRFAFRNRMTAQEREDIEFAASDNPNLTDTQRRQAARLRAFLKDLDAADFIDLDRADLLQALQWLETKGILSSGRGTQIVTPDGTDDEEWVK